MGTRLYLIASGFLFLVVGALHLLRLFLQVQIQIGSWIVPMWLSFLGTPVALGLSIWAYQLQRRQAEAWTAQRRAMSWVFLGAGALIFLADLVAMIKGRTNAAGLALGVLFVILGWALRGKGQEPRGPVDRGNATKALTPKQ